MFIGKKILANGQIIAVPIYAANASPALVIQHPQSVLPRQCRLLIYRSHYRAVFHGIMGQIQQHPIFYLRKSGCSISFIQGIQPVHLFLPVTIQRKIHIIQSSKGSAVAAGIITDRSRKFTSLIIDHYLGIQHPGKLMFCTAP